MRAALLEVLQTLEARDLKGIAYEALERPNEVAERCWLTKYRASAPEVARRASCALPGQWWAGTGSVTWNNGGKCVTLLDETRWEAVTQARALAATLMGEVKAFTVGGVARALLAWVGAPWPHYACTQKALGGIPWSYRVCVPGVYEGRLLVDMVCAYHQALLRLPSLHLHWLPERPIWHPMPANEAARWRDLKEAVIRCKPLRLVLHGNMLGGGRAPVCYHRGLRLPMKARGGPYRSAALAAVRAGYELCWLQAEEAATPYANTDAVLLAKGGRPAAWERWGYEWRLEAEGQAHLLGLDVFRVGERQTAWYGAGSRFELPCAPTPAPPSLTLACWH